MSMELFWFCLGMMFAGFVDSTFIVLRHKYKTRNKPYDWAKEKW